MGASDKRIVRLMEQIIELIEAEESLRALTKDLIPVEHETKFHEGQEHRKNAVPVIKSSLSSWEERFRKKKETLKKEIAELLTDIYRKERKV